MSYQDAIEKGVELLKLYLQNFHMIARNRKSAFSIRFYEYPCV